MTKGSLVKALYKPVGKDSAMYFSIAMYVQRSSLHDGFSGQRLNFDHSVMVSNIACYIMNRCEVQTTYLSWHNLGGPFLEDHPT